MSHPDVSQHTDRSSAATDARRLPLSEALVWGLGLVPMSWRDDDAASEAFIRTVPELFPDEAAAPADRGAAPNLSARHSVRRIIDDTLARLGKKRMYAVSAGRLTIYRPSPRPVDQPSEDLAHVFEPRLTVLPKY